MCQAGNFKTGQIHVSCSAVLVLQVEILPKVKTLSHILYFLETHKNGAKNGTIQKVQTKTVILWIACQVENKKQFRASNSRSVFNICFDNFIIAVGGSVQMNRDINEYFFYILIVVVQYSVAFIICDIWSSYLRFHSTLLTNIMLQQEFHVTKNSHIFYSTLTVGPRKYPRRGICERLLTKSIRHLTIEHETSRDTQSVFCNSNTDSKMFCGIYSEFMSSLFYVYVFVNML